MDINFSLIIFLCILRIGVYFLLGGGWSSNSSYRLLGGIRSVAQTISYEVSFALIIVSLVVMIISYNIILFCKFNVLIIVFTRIFFL